MLWMTTPSRLRAVVFAQACFSLCSFAVTPTIVQADPPSIVEPSEKKAQLLERDQLWNDAHLLMYDGQREKAIELAEKIVAIERSLFGDMWSDLAESYKLLVKLHSSGDNFAAARRCLVEIHKIKTKEFGADAWQTVEARLAITEVDRAAKLTADERKQLDQADKLHDQVLGMVLERNFVAATPLAEQALSIRKKILGQRHRSFAAGLVNLAICYQSVGDYAKAEPLYSQSLEILKEVLGEKHPDYATNLNNFGMFYAKMRDYQRAAPIIRQALDIRREILGEKHPAFANSLFNIAELCREMGHLERAEKYYRQSLEIRKEVLGEKHPDVADCLYRRYRPGLSVKVLCKCLAGYLVSKVT
jgi:tetratricopeptide (TPR) repeat protein